MPRYRRVPLTREKSLQAALTSVVVGAGAAAVTWVVVRLFLSRDPLTPPLLPAAEGNPPIAPGSRQALAAGEATSVADTAAEAGPGDE